MDSTIQIPPDSTGKYLDTEQLDVGGTDVQRQRVQLAGAADTDIVLVTSALAPSNAPSALANLRHPLVNYISARTTITPGSVPTLFGFPTPGYHWRIVCVQWCVISNGPAELSIYDNISTPYSFCRIPTDAHITEAFTPHLCIQADRPIRPYSTVAAAQLECAITAYEALPT